MKNMPMSNWWRWSRRPLSSTASASSRRVPGGWWLDGISYRTKPSMAWGAQTRSCCKSRYSAGAGRVSAPHALAADGISQREIAERLGINRRTVARLARSDEPPRYRRTPTGSQLDPLEPVLRRLLEEWPQIKAPRLTEILRDES